MLLKWLFFWDVSVIWKALSPLSHVLWIAPMSGRLKQWAVVRLTFGTSQCQVLCVPLSIGLFPIPPKMWSVVVSSPETSWWLKRVVLVLNLYPNLETRLYVLRLWPILLAYTRIRER